MIQIPLLKYPRTIMLFWIMSAILCLCAIISFIFFDSNVGSYNPLYIRQMAFFLGPGFNCYLWPLITLIFLGRKQGRTLCLCATSVGFSYIASRIIKFFVGRPRPQIDNLPWHPFTLLDRYQSFPSGHAAVATALFAALALRFPKYRLYFLLLAITTPFIRVLQGKHHLSDVLLGEAIGLAIAYILYTRYNDPFYKLLLKIFGGRDGSKPRDQKSQKSRIPR